jgi:hypothetical protein
MDSNDAYSGGAGVHHACSEEDHQDNVPVSRLFFASPSSIYSYKKKDDQIDF